MRMSVIAYKDARRVWTPGATRACNTMIRKLTLGNSNTGYDTCKIEISSTSGKAKLVKGTLNGRSSVLRKCVANYNKGLNYYLTTAGDQLPFVINLA